MSTSPPALNWLLAFVEANNLDHELHADVVGALESKHARVQVNRVFRRHIERLPPILSALAAAHPNIDASNCSITRDTWTTAHGALIQIIDGETPSTAWGMGKARGPKPGWSLTLEASALVTYLMNEADLAYTQEKAVEIAAELFKINPHNIRKFDRMSPGNETSAAIVALWALERENLLQAADRYFDVDTLIEAACNDSTPITG